MMMKAISSLELAGIVSELQELTGARVKKIYQVGKRLVFELYKERRVNLVVEAGRRINITGYKEEKPKVPPGFCTLLRKRLSGSRLVEIRQHGFDRVVALKFEGKETYSLVAELFAKGNLILCDSEMIIVQPMRVEFWSSRAVKPKAEYVFPPAGPNLLEIGEDGFEEVLRSSKKNLVSTLVGLGLGKKGEEVCDKLGIEREIEVEGVGKKDMGRLWTEVSGLVEDAKASKGLDKIIDERFAEGIGEELEDELEEKKRKAIERWEKRRSELEEAIGELEKRAGESRENGEWIQVNNLEVQRILDGVRKDLKAGIARAEVERKYGVIIEGEKVIIKS